MSTYRISLGLGTWDIPSGAISERELHLIFWCPQCTPDFKTQHMQRCWSWKEISVFIKLLKLFFPFGFCRWGAWVLFSFSDEHRTCAKRKRRCENRHPQWRKKRCYILSITSKIGLKKLCYVWGMNEQYKYIRSYHPYIQSEAFPILWSSKHCNDRDHLKKKLCDWHPKTKEY